MISTNKQWNTWSPFSFTRMEHVGTGFAIVPGAFSEEEKSYSQFPFDENMRLYEHDKDGRYCRLQAQHAHAVFEIEYLKPDPWTVLLRMRNIVQPREWGIRYHMLVSLGFPKFTGTVRIEENGAFHGITGSYHIACACVEPPYDIIPVKNEEQVGELMSAKGFKSTCEQSDNVSLPWATVRFVLEASPEVCMAISIANDFSAAQHKAHEALAAFDRWDILRNDILKTRPSNQDENHAGMLEALGDIMNWNDMVDQRNGNAYTSITKNWNASFGGWYLFFSDACYQLLLKTMANDTEMVQRNMDNLLSAATPAGNFAGMLSEWQNWCDRTQPPVLGYCALTHYLVTGERSILEKALPAIVRAADWYLNNRDIHGKHLIQLGTSATGKGNFKGTKMAAKNETAMDNSPMYDKASFDARTGLMNQYDVGISSQLALDLECAAIMADVLDEPEISVRMHENSTCIKDAINDMLWNEDTCMYANRNLDGSFGLTSPTSFYPLAAGAADEKRVTASIRHIFDPEEFFTACPLIAIHASDPSAKENKYWRGRTWAPQPFWTYVGLRRVGRDDEAYRLADAAVKYFDKNWSADRRSYENYNPYTGEGNDSVDSDFFYSWTALLPLMWSMEQFCVDPWNGLSFGMLHGEIFSQTERRYMGCRYDISSDGAMMRVIIDGKAVLATDLCTRFKQFSFGEHHCSFHVQTEKAGIIRWEDKLPKLVYLNGELVEPGIELSLSPGEYEILRLS